MFSQNRRFWKTDAKSEQKGSKNDIQIELWALWGSIFVILGVFLKRQFFDEFSTALRHNRRAPREELNRNDLTRNAILTLLVFTPPRQRAHRPHGPFEKGAAWGEWALWAHGALWGISEAISSGWLFRVDGYYEWMAVSLGTCQEPKYPKYQIVPR